VECEEEGMRRWERERVKGEKWVGRKSGGKELWGYLDGGERLSRIEKGVE
jgi:hypothetical protein